MRIIDLHLQGVGPFKTEHLEFITEKDDLEKPPVTIITGENGTGKTIVLDAIRGLMFGAFDYVGRDIFNGQDVDLNVNVEFSNEELNIDFKEFHTGHSPRRFTTTQTIFNQFFNSKTPNWIANYWDSKLGRGTFEIKNLSRPDILNPLKGALNGSINNADITAIMVFFEYLERVF